MNTKAVSALLALLALLLAACGDGVSEVGPGGVSADDAQELDAAAAKLEADAVGRPATDPESKN